ncbi:MULTISPECIES: hypothetical protein [Dyadobacter]|uniref:Uncharacterized protein n=1 Tax=Dyadobacter chenhuakuii TaxID=2909339 RepID=A0ABY4XJY0_9BACT|nr:MULTISPECIES: hypothetical protein [Dyadobacter]MCF2496447.1 hypothetical protein [Dyadobacter chenhuakuii]MCF2519386.1 hypothetical protein [Dyadobacter sp. CY351]USJ30503.1 hypothetical protein NFI80_21925 [Dyadobacter chenhuakuii]
MIRISTLPLIETTAQFDAATLILLVDVLFVGDTPRKMREHIKANHGGFIYDKKTFIPITLTGTPGSLIANAGTPIVFKFDHGFQNDYHFNGNLDAAIFHKKLYDISHLAGEPSIQFVKEEDFIIERYLSGAREYTEPEKEAKLLAPVAKMPAIGQKAMKGLTPVRK